MKKWQKQLVSVLAAAGMVFAMAGQAAASSETSENAVAETTTGGELVLGTQSDVIFTPSWMIRGYTDRAVYSLVYEPLVKLDENGDWYPYLLESLTPDPENLTWTCVVRDGVTFSDGTPFDADALLWNFENYLENSNTSSTHFGSVESFEKTDDKTVVIHLTTWTSQIPYSFQDNCGYMYSPAAYEENGAEWCDLHAVGTGPYVEEDMQPGSYRTFVKNENYWNKDEAEGAYDTITWKVCGDESTAQAALLSGELDGYFSPSFGMLDTMLSQDGYYLAQNTTTFMLQFLIPPSNIEGSGWEDENVRKAAYYAIDSQAIIDSVTYGYGTYTNQYAGPETSYYNDEIEGYGYDLEKAKELMAQSEYPDGFTTKLYASNENTALYTSIGVAVQSQLAEIGIEVEIELLEPAVWVETFMNAQDGFMVGGHGFGMNLANQMLSNFSQDAEDGVGMMCYSKIHPDDLDQTIRAAVGATDTDTMVENIKAANKLISDEYAVAYPIYLQPAYYCLYSDNVVDSGCFNNTSLSFDFTKVAPAAE
ncbi:MAG TPA: ABC transporter substrate-binding protein [Candidatus Blautia faecipullorum]|nr:ABC transporter substrate-binding protein [Candidatus Blautia faecipullorum]